MKDIMIEKFKDIPWYEWHYQVSNLGRVKSIKFTENKILKFWCKKQWYCQYVLSLNWKKKNLLWHRLVLMTFKWISKLDINHKNWIKNDNRLENLEYCTKSENQLHRYQVLKKLWWFNFNHYNKWQFWEKNIKSKIVFQYNLDWKLLNAYKWVREIARKLWLSHACISNCCNWKRKTAWRFIWKYN